LDELDEGHHLLESKMQKYNKKSPSQLPLESNLISKTDAPNPVHPMIRALASEIKSISSTPTPDDTQIPDHWTQPEPDLPESHWITGNSYSNHTSTQQSTLTREKFKLKILKDQSQTQEVFQKLIDNNITLKHYIYRADDLKTQGHLRTTKNQRVALKQFDPVENCYNCLMKGGVDSEGVDVRVLRFNESWGGGESVDLEVFKEVRGERGVLLDSMQ
jgi:hypothetical protein